MESLTVTSITAFGPKILESQYYVPAGRAALLYGLVTVLVALFGNMLGKYIVACEDQDIYPEDDLSSRKRQQFFFCLYPIFSKFCM